MQPTPPWLVEGKEDAALLRSTEEPKTNRVSEQTRTTTTSASHISTSEIQGTEFYELQN